MLCPLSPADLGRRITVRAQRPDGSVFDTVGPLTSMSAGHATVAGRKGSVDLAWPPHADPALPRAIAARVVAPEISAVDIQRIAQSGWPPEVVEPLSGWELRWAQGVTWRCNSVRVAADPSEDLAATLVAVIAWYDARGLPATLQVPRPWLAEPLREEGWQPTRGTRMMTSACVDLIAPQGHHDHGVGSRAQFQIALSDRPDAGWMAAVEREDGGDRAALQAIMERPTHTAFATMTAGTYLVGVARASLNDGWCGITNVVTHPDWRRQGVATALTSHLAQWALGKGVRQACLQVLEDNSAAIAMYEGLGFARHHSYDYWRPSSTV